MTATRLPRTAKDVFQLSPKDWVVYNGLIALHRVTGWWRYPVPSSGDLETMRLMDKVYWLYKARYLVERAARGSGLEDFFARQRQHVYDVAKLEAAIGGEAHRFDFAATANNRATILERNGIAIGVVSHTFGLNARRPPRDKPWLVNRAHLNGRVDELDDAVLRAQVQFCRDHNVDLVVAQLHWGMEHESYPRPAQLEMARHLAELGFDVIVGHHPHVIQPMECYRTRRDPDRVVPIYYSLGNLITPFTHPAFRQSLVGRVAVAKGRCRDGRIRTYVAKAEGIDVSQEIDERGERLWLRSLHD